MIVFEDNLMLLHHVKDASYFGRIFNKNILLKTLGKEVNMFIVFFVLFSVFLEDLILLLILVGIIAFVLLNLVIRIWHKKVEVFLNQLVSVLTVELMSPLVMKISKIMFVIELALVKLLKCFHMKTGPYMIKVLRFCFEDFWFFSRTNIVLYVHYFLSK